MSGFASTNKEVQLAALVICTNLMKHMIATKVIKFRLSEIDLIANSLGLEKRLILETKHKQISSTGGTCSLLPLFNLLPQCSGVYKNFKM